MSNIFNAFLNGVVDPAQGDMRDYAHANRLYVQNNYIRAPKMGFLYFVSFEINENATSNPAWDYPHVGTLVKKIDLPKFSPATETLNQYNRKTVVQTHLKYNPISMEFHDDNGELTRNLWLNYYQYYYVDTNYRPSNANIANNNELAYRDSKYSNFDFYYGLNGFQRDPFFKEINIYVLHQHRFSQYTLVNPIITEWSHDTLDQDVNNKVLANKMSVAYENVYYGQGTINKKDTKNGPQFTAIWYDNSPSPLSVAGKGVSSLLGSGGVIAGATDVFSTLSDPNAGITDYLRAAVETKNLTKNISKLSASGIANEANNVISNALGGVSALAGTRSSSGYLESAVAGAQQYTTALPVQLIK